MTKAPEKIAYCQVDANLDTNPKIRKAGRDGRDIFEFLLRRVALGRTAGSVPLKYIECWYLADMLMMSEDEARNGIARAVDAGLIGIDQEGGVVRLLGWTEEWGRRPKEGKERQAEYRAKHAKGRPPGDGALRGVTGGDESDAGEERRGEEINKKGGEVTPPEVVTMATLAIGEINRLARTHYEADSKSALKYAASLLKNRHSADDVLAVIRSKRDWLSKPDMKEHFCPDTLLGPANFQKYLDNWRGKNRKPQPQQLTIDQPKQPRIVVAGGKEYVVE